MYYRNLECFARNTDRGRYRERVWNVKVGECGRCFVFLSLLFDNVKIDGGKIVYNLLL